MSGFTPKAASEPHTINRLTVRLHTDGMNGGQEFDAVVARNIPVELVYTYTATVTEDGEETIKAAIKIAAIRTTGPAWFDSESGAVLSFSVGYCLLKMMNEHDVEALEEELMKKLEAK